MGENSQAKVSIGKELGSLVKKNIRDYMMYIVLVAIIAFFALRGPFGDASGLAKVASMMTGSYIGGGVNFAAMASQYAAGEDLTAAATVADNLLMAAYFFVLIAFAGMKFFR